MDGVKGMSGWINRSRAGWMLALGWMLTWGASLAFADEMVELPLISDDSVHWEARVDRRPADLSPPHYADEENGTAVVIPSWSEDQDRGD